MDSETVTCAGCGQEMGIDDDYCWGHEEDCPRHDDPELEIECTCNLNYHHQCCPECNNVEYENYEAYDEHR